MTVTAASAEPAGGSTFLIGLLPWVLIFVIFWFLLIRPQQKRAREHAAMIAAVKKGDEVITGGGLRGRVTKVTEMDVEVEIAQGVKVRAIKGTLSSVLTSNAKPAND
ncbi:MAG TPA: preprotein translocase subunit YajC [Sphingomicrobium sp.]|nr:preprotein translocase subunit YajC [Sphingomicrobium sp.]